MPRPKQKESKVKFAYISFVFLCEGRRGQSTVCVHHVDQNTEYSVILGTILYVRRDWLLDRGALCSLLLLRTYLNTLVPMEVHLCDPFGTQMRFRSLRISCIFSKTNETRFV